VGPAGAPLIMFANSLGTNFHVFDPQAAHLVGRYRVLRYDMRGHGLTDCPPAGATGYRMDQLATDALVLLDVLGERRAAFCGLSIGGMVGQTVAARAPERISCLVLLDTAAQIGPTKLWDDRVAAVRRGGIAAIAEGVLQRWFTPRFLAVHPEVTSGVKNMLERTPPDGYIGCGLAIRDTDLAAQDAAIVCPTLVIVGAQDQATPPAGAHALAQAIAGAQLETLAEAAHISSLEQPDALNRLLAGFFARHASAVGHG
jgi:3-oxoadipate enol-lactonase